MTQLLLEIPRHQDVELLLVLLRRLGVRIVQSSVALPPPSPENEEEVAFILAGLPAKKDFEGFAREFEESRRDSVLADGENLLP